MHQATSFQFNYNLKVIKSKSKYLQKEDLRKTLKVSSLLFEKIRTEL